MKHIAGVDEAGRGPLAGPVVASAVILPNDHGIEGLKDSKKLSELRREKLFGEIREKATSIGIGIVHEDEIDRTNILQATRRAMRKAISQLNPRPDEVLIDGYGLPDQVVPNKGIIGGDETVPLISAASIIAKVTRDHIMKNYANVFPDYGFEKHKGYGTPQHMKIISELKACSIHRKSFSPVKENLPSLNHLKKNRLLGKWGEQLAARHLVHQGYFIQKMNFNAAPYGEIDVVANNALTTVFVEVKSATQTTLGELQDQIDESKLEKLSNAFESYIASHEQETDYRFDIITVLFGHGKPKIQHYKDCLN